MENDTFLANDTSSAIVFLSREERTVLTIVFLSLFLFGFIGNAIVVYGIITSGRHADVPTNIFVLSQAFADLGTATSIPIYITHMYIFIWEVFYLYTSLVWLASLGSLFLLTVNRLVSVVDSLRYVRHITPRRAKFLVLVNWTIALMCALWQVLDLHSPGVYPNFGRYYIVVLILCVLSSDWYMFRESRLQAKKIKRQQTVVTGLQRNLREDFRSVRTIALVGGTFLLSCLPFTLVVFVYGDDKRTVRFQRNAAFWGPLMALNSIVDPVIYYFRSAEFRVFYQRYKRFQQRRKINMNAKTNRHAFALFNEKKRVTPWV